MYYVHVGYFTGTGKVGNAVRYVAHREERLPGGQQRELYGIGEWYRALAGNERAIVSQLREDAQGLKAPRYYRIKLTVDDRAAERLARIGSSRLEPVLRDAVEKTFRGAFRQAQGVFVIHQNERGTRRFGNPHVHVVLSPLLADRKTFFVSKHRLEIFKQRWEREVGRALERYERRPGLDPARASGRERPARTRATAQVRHPLNAGLVAAATLMAEGKTRAAAATAARSLPGLPGQAARLQRDLEDAATNPERLARRYAFKLVTRFVPAPVRRAVNLTRTLGLLIPRG
jgi:hypothetical protein